MKRGSARRTGRRGERAALWFLRLKGFHLRHRNWRGGGGELDLVMSRRHEIIFVEVKTRSSQLFGGATAAVTREKQAHIVHAAAAYLSRFDLWDAPCRFDVISVEKTRRFPFWKVTHFVNAFQPDLGRRL